MLNFDLNWLAVIVAAIVNMVVGSLWYGPIFGNVWMKAVGKTRETLGNPVVPMITSMVMNLLVTIGCAIILNNIVGLNLGAGILVGLIIGLLFVTASSFTSNAFDGGNRLLPVLFGAYQTIAITLGAIILTLWR